MKILTYCSLTLFSACMLVEVHTFPKNIPEQRARAKISQKHITAVTFHQNKRTYQNPQAKGKYLAQLETH